MKSLLRAHSLHFSRLCTSILLATLLAVTTHVQEVRCQPIHVIALDSIVGMPGMDTVYSDQATELLFRITSITGSWTQTTEMRNGFHVYSPTGAHWTTIMGGFTEAITDAMAYTKYALHWDANGSGVDTVLFWTGGACGLPPDFDEVSLKLTIGPIDSQYIGHTICLDSGNTRLNTDWRWNLGVCDVGYGVVIPSWVGPQCFTVARRPCILHLTGDVNVDSLINSADIIRIVKYVFKNGADPDPCTAAADVNCSVSITSADVVVLVNHVFKGGPAPCNSCGLIWNGTWACP